jgi:hypothetical protein
MKKERQFLHDLHRGRVLIVPFIELFQNDKELRNELFRRYLKTDTKPDFSLYLNNYYSNKELDKGFEDSNKNIPVKNFGMASFVPQTDFEISLKEIESEFYTLCAKKEIPEEFHKHSISRTHLFEKLKKIDERIMDFNLYVTKEKDYNAKGYAEAFAKHLIHALESIDIPLLTKLVLEDFIKKEEFNQNRFDVLFSQTYAADTAKVNYREIVMFAINAINDYLKSLSYEKQEITPLIQAVSVQELKNKSESNSLPVLSLQEFGLKLAFEERQVTRENCDKIVQEIGLNSGGKLYQWYNEYASRTNRKGKPNPYTLTKLNNKIKTFEKVIDFLDEDYKAKAIDELNILQSFKELDFH